WLAFGGETDEFSNVMVVPVAGGTPRQVSFVANAFLGSIAWSAKGDYIVYRTNQRTEDSRLVKVDMVPLPPTFDEDRFRELFNQPRDTAEARGRGDRAATRDSADGAVPVPAEIEIEFDGIRRRGAFV